MNFIKAKPIIIYQMGSIIIIIIHNNYHSDTSDVNNTASFYCIPILKSILHYIIYNEYYYSQTNHYLSNGFYRHYNYTY